MDHLNQPPHRADAPVVRPVQLLTGTLLSKDLEKSRRFYEDMLGLECVRCDADRLLARAPRASTEGERRWVLEVRQSDSISNPQHVLHHWGIDLVSKAAVDQMHSRLKAHQAEYGIGVIHDPLFQHASYAFYFCDMDANWWEFEFLPPGRLEKIYEQGDVM